MVPAEPGTGAHPAAAALEMLRAGRAAEAEAAAARLTGSGDPLALGALALASLCLGRYPQAVDVAGRAAGACPSREWPRRLRSLGLRRLERWRDALIEAREAVRLEPESAAARGALAVSLMGARREAEAREEARLAVRLAPRDAEARRLLGDLMLDPDPALAEQAYRASLGLRPAHPPTLYRLGVALDRQGRDEEAEAAFAEAERLDPAVMSPGRRRREALSWVQRALVLFLLSAAMAMFPSFARRLWPALGAAGAFWLWAVALLVPLGLVAWAALRLSLRRGLSRSLDTEVETMLLTLSEEMAAAEGGAGREPPRAAPGR